MSAKLQAIALVAVVMLTGYLVGMVASEQVRVWWDSVSPMGGM